MVLFSQTAHWLNPAARGGDDVTSMGLWGGLVAFLMLPLVYVPCLRWIAGHVTGTAARAVAAFSLAPVVAIAPTLLMLAIFTRVFSDVLWDHAYLQVYAFFAGFALVCMPAWMLAEQCWRLPTPAKTSVS